MNQQQESRRLLLKQGSLGLGWAATASWGGGAVMPSKLEAVTQAQHYASLPVLAEVDVLVCGGGAAGIGAGLGAAQQGADTLVIENCTFFGGVISWMVGMEMNQMRPKGKGRSKYPLLPKAMIIRQVAKCGFSFYNNEGSLVLGNMLSTDLKERTQTETQLSRQLVQNVQAMREFGSSEEVKNTELVGAGQQVSPRESRRLHGEYTLTIDDIETGTAQPDTIAWRTGGIDVGPGGLYKPKGMRIFDIPYRSLLPIKVDGLIVAGRCISADHIPELSGKSIGNQFAVGQGVGTAAAVAAERGVLPRKIDIGRVQKILADDGVDLYPSNRSTQA